MKKDTYYLLMLLSFGILLLLLAGCSSSSGSVPDQQAQILVQDYLDECGFSYNDFSFRVDHQVDKQTHTDSVVIGLTIEYNYATENTYLPVTFTYDKSADLWSVSRKGTWAEPSYALRESALAGNWKIQSYNNTYNIMIKGVSGNKVNVDYTASLSASAGFGTSVYCDLRGQETCAIQGLGVHIPITLPNSFYCDKGGGNVGNESTEIIVTINPQDGITNASVYGTITYNP